MAGERLATLILHVDVLEYGTKIGIWLGGGHRYFTAVQQTQTNQFQPLPAGHYFVLGRPFNAGVGSFDNARALARAVQATITSLDLPYVATAELADDPNWQAAGWQHLVKVVATRYDHALDFAFPTQITPGPGFDLQELQRLSTIKPVRVEATVTPAGIFGSATGAITLSANTDPGINGSYKYAWADDPTAPGSLGAIGPVTRTGLRAGSYTCTVTQRTGFLGDVPGASTTVTVVVGSDPRLEVLVERSGNDVLLVPSGGLAPYAYAWADGPTTAARRALLAGTYRCTVTDARGARVEVSVPLEVFRFYWSQNPVTTALDAGGAYRADPSTKPNLSFACEVFVEADYLSGEFTRVASLEQPADRQGRTVFDVQALLDAYLHEHLPALNQRRASRADSLFRRFYLKTGEVFGTPPAPAALSDQAEQYVVLGGLSDEEHAADTWFAGRYQARARPFLTWEPNDKRVLPAQPEYLYYMVDSFDLPAFRQRARLHLADGTSQEFTFAVVTGIRRFEVYCLPAGYAQLTLDTIGLEAPVVAWDVWVADEDGVPQTEVRRYHLDQGYYPEQRFFLYTNSLGGVNTLAALGQAKRVLDVKAELAERPRYDPLLGDTLVLAQHGQSVLSISTGPRRRAQLIADQELLLSPRVTLQSGGQYWPGTVKAKSTPVLDESDALPALEFDFVLPRQRRFSPRLPVGVPDNVALLPVAGGEGPQP